MLPILLLLAQTQPEYYLATLEGKFMAICHKAEETPIVMFPLPRDYRGQVPLSFKLDVKPKSRLKSVRTYETPTGDQIAELTFTPMKRDDRVDIEWKSEVLTDMTERFDLAQSKATAPPSQSNSKATAQPEQWLKPTKFVDSDHPKIVAKAAEFKGATVAETINKTVVGTVAIRSKQKGQAREMTASIALEKSGSCTSNANLLAALLRANGIPARILSGYPTWANAPYQTHYIVEAYVDGFGWYPIEPTLYASGWNCSNMPIVSIVSIENEEKGVERLQGGAGVAYLSLNEASAGLVVRGLFTKTFSDHKATLAKKPYDWPVSLRGSGPPPLKTWSDAQTRWASWLRVTRESRSDFP